MNSSTMDLLGKALLDYQTRGNAETLSLVREDGFTDEFPVAAGLFACELDSDIERMAMDACRGRVLGVAAVAGPGQSVVLPVPKAANAFNRSVLGAEDSGWGDRSGGAPV